MPPRPTEPELSSPTGQMRRGWLSEVISGLVFFVLFLSINLAISHDAAWRSIVGALIATLLWLLIFRLWDYATGRFTKRSGNKAAGQSRP